MPKPNKKPINWVDVRAEYEAGGISLRELAAKTGVSESTLFRRSTKGSWVANASKIDSKVTAVLTAKSHEKIIEKRVEQALSDLEKTEKFIKHCFDKIDNYDFRSAEGLFSSFDKMMRLKLEFSDERIHEYCLKKGYVLTPIAELETSGQGNQSKEQEPDQD